MTRPKRYRPKNGLDASLESALPKKRKKERYRLFREYVQINDKLSVEEADTLIAKWQREYAHNYSLIEVFVMPNFINWHIQKVAQLFSERGKKAQRKRSYTKN